MTAQFKEGDPVDSRHGKGTVTYCEDGYLEIRLDKDGTERSFWAPFEDKAWPRAGEVNPEPGSGLWDVIVDSPAMAPLLQAARIDHAATSIMIAALGGSAAKWEELSSLQKMNFVAVYTGQQLESLELAFKEGLPSDITE